MYTFVIIVILTYVVFQAIEIASFGARVAGRIVNRRALGTTLAQTIYTASRFLLIIFLPSLGYIVESGINIDDYIIVVSVTFSLTFIVSIIKSTIPVAFLKSLIGKRADYDIKACNSFTFKKIIIKKTLVSFVAYLFLTSGFFIAFMLAVLFPDNRLTLSQFTSLFHGFGAVIFAFYLDPMLSRSIDTDSDDIIWLKNVYSILLGRTISYLVMVVLLILFFLSKNYLI